MSATTPRRGRDVRKMDKPYTCREVVFTCSNGWTIERVSEEDQGMEGFFMGHCLGKPNGEWDECEVADYVETLSLREPDGTPHVTIADGLMVGRCNQAPKDSYQALCFEYNGNFRPQHPSERQRTYRRPDGETLADVQV